MKTTPKSFDNMSGLWGLVIWLDLWLGLGLVLGLILLFVLFGFMSESISVFVIWLELVLGLELVIWLLAGFGLVLGLVAGLVVVLGIGVLLRIKGISTRKIILKWVFSTIKASNVNDVNLELHEGLPKFSSGETKDDSDSL